jgi:hypothetical protein
MDNILLIISSIDQTASYGAQLRRITSTNTAARFALALARAPPTNTVLCTEGRVFDSNAAELRAELPQTGFCRIHTDQDSFNWNRPTSIYICSNLCVYMCTLQKIPDSNVAQIGAYQCSTNASANNRCHWCKVVCCTLVHQCSCHCINCTDCALLRPIASTNTAARFALALAGAPPTNIKLASVEYQQIRSVSTGIDQHQFTCVGMNKLL